MKIGILVDSSAGLQSENLNGTNIEVLPLQIVLSDELSFPDTPENNEKHQTLKIVSEGGKVTTSQASPGEVIEKYEAMLKKYDHLIHITISENLSSMKQTAMMVANDDQFKGKVTILEHCHAANVIGELALKFNKMSDNKNVKIEDFQKESDQWMKHSASVIIPGDLSRLSKGGRAKSILFSILKMLKTKLAIMWGYKPSKIVMGRTVGSLLPKIKVAVEKKCGKNIQVFFLYTPFTSEKLIEAVKTELAELKLAYSEKFVPMPFVCHAGTETIAFIVVDKNLI
ncbi:DegV family protein [Spiroplasma clarkii]|uniref:DegV family protein n=1 Tax=Spiroplasma clarkii TaxID=2139 RepID=A0A1Y0L061_9MOLU|nr:DegV family protein [Spiroplasma clarkii]ARU91160.1 DegV family protein [Spiroplasma clarkii]ATX70598.1 DegV family protein [Spiroplasma clarkii]